MAKEFNWIDNYMKYTENTEPPILYRKWVAVSAVAAMLQRKTKMEIGTLEVYPNLYIILVGGSGVRKGTAMKPASNILYQLSNVNLASESITREALIQQMVNNSNDGMLIDGTPLFHNSTTIFSEELTVFLGYGNLELLANLTEWFDCGKGPEGVWTYETIGRGQQKISGVWVNLLGATTPDLIRRSLPVDAVGGGFTSRVIFVYADKKEKSVPIMFLTDEQKEIKEQLLIEGENIVSLKGNFIVTEGFLKDRYVPWYIEQDENNPFKHIKNFEGYSQRRAMHLLKVCMIMSASRSREMIVREVDFDNAYKLLKETEVKMPRTFAGYGENDAASVIENIMSDLAECKVMKKSDIMRKYYSDINVEQLDEILRVVSTMGKVKIIMKEDDTFIEWLDN